MLRSTLSVDTPEGIELNLPVAGLVVRAIAWSIDFSLRMLVYISVFLLFGVVAITDMIESISDGGDRVAYLIGISSLVYFLFEWFFTTIPEALYGTTPGKKIMGLRVVHLDGTPLSWQSAVLRNFLRFADFMPFLYFSAVVSMLIDRNSRRLGDLAAGSMVVYNQSSHNRTAESFEQAGLAPPLQLLPPERAAVLDFDERCDGLTEQRQIELAELLADLDIGRGTQAVATVRAWARWIRSGKTEQLDEHTDAA